MRMIDSDVHVRWQHLDDLAKHMAEPWRTYLLAGKLTHPHNGYPNPIATARRDAAPPGGGQPGSDPAFLVEDLIDRYDMDYVVLVGESYQLALSNLANADAAAALAAAYNDWLIERWLSHDRRILGSIFIAAQDPALAAREIERVAAHPQFVCIAVCNGTAGLELAVWALGLTGEVIAPSFTFIATIHALHRSGLKPIFCDIDPRTHNLDPACVEAAITPATSGIVGVHVWGRPCAVDELTRCAQSHGLRLMFDAAHAFACSSGGRMIGSFGALEVFSFHATKFLHTLEGGAIALNDDALAHELRRLRNFGFSGIDRVVSAGTNAKMHEFSAAVGLTLMEQLDELLHVNRERHDQHRRALSEIPGLSLLAYDPSERNNYQYLVVEVDETWAGIDRDTLVSVLWAENVRARRYFWPGCHRMAPYATLYPDAGAALPHTERLTRRILCLPTGAALSASELEKLSDLLYFVIAHSPEIRHALNQ